MILLAYRNLFQSKVRLLISTGGLAVALMLILTLDAIMTGVERQITAYVDHSGADIFVSQDGVQNMHMASSSIPAKLIGEISAIKGVKEVTPILYLTNMVVVGEERNLAYIIGIPEDAGFGSAWTVTVGKTVPGTGEAIIDRSVAETSGVGLGDNVQILGQPFIVAGLSEGTTSLVNSVAFISLSDFQVLRGTMDTVSFFLIQVEPGEQPEDVTRLIKAKIDQVNVQTRQAFAVEERRVVKDMSTDIITIMNLVGFLIGLAVMALTVYTATLSR